MQNPSNILIADDHSVVRQGASMILKQAFENVNVVHAEIFSKVLEHLRTQTFHFIVLDIAIPEGSGVKMIELIRAIQPDVKILIFSAYEEEIYAMRYLKAGANGYLNKLSSEDEFKLAFLAMINNEGYASDNIKAKLAEQHNKKQTNNPIEMLSNREFEIARLLVNGDGNLEIGNKLKLQNSTVSTYKTRIFEKLSVNSVVGLISVFKAYDLTA
ncbi:response regulator transcription factor [Flavobacterium pallidum]|uniref:DNA-binding response regulator n=1 Tax=Flavobacterium pallidum TaxID=2172098 RepID=A0A2S1SDJ1_9FLAO|nr:response regulator transcription factor [Flavobacterium pallidum]AWI24432.1 DNA-binding response regulator [Flavobacterium pallidum]